MPKVCVFVVEDDLIGTLGADPPSANFSCVPGIAVDDEAISSSSADLLSVVSGFNNFEVEDGSGGLDVESRVDFAVEEVESIAKISIFGYDYTLAQETMMDSPYEGAHCDIPRASEFGGSRWVFGGRSSSFAMAVESGISSLGTCAISMLIWGDQSTSMRLQVVVRTGDQRQGRRACVTSLFGDGPAVPQTRSGRVPKSGTNTMMVPTLDPFP